MMSSKFSKGWWTAWLLFVYVVIGISAFGEIGSLQAAYIWRWKDAISSLVTLSIVIGIGYMAGRAWAPKDNVTNIEYANINFIKSPQTSSKE